MQATNMVMDQELILKNHSFHIQFLFAATLFAAQAFPFCSFLQLSAVLQLQGMQWDAAAHGHHWAGLAMASPWACAGALKFQNCTKRIDARNWI